MLSRNEDTADVFGLSEQPASCLIGSNSLVQRLQLHKKGFTIIPLVTSIITVSIILQSSLQQEREMICGRTMREKGS